MNWLNEKEKLKKLLIIDNKSYEEVGRLYKVTGAAIKKQCKKLGFELKNRRKINPKETFNKGKNKIEKQKKENKITFPNNVLIKQKHFSSFKNCKNIGEIGEIKIYGSSFR